MKHANDDDTWTSIGFQAQLVLNKLRVSVELTEIDHANGGLRNSVPIDQHRGEERRNADDDGDQPEEHHTERQRHALAKCG